MNKSYSIMHKSIGILIVTLFTISCSDFLKVEPKSQISGKTLWSSTNNADLFLNNIYEDLPSVMNKFDPWENWSDDSMDGIDAAQSRSVYAVSAYTPSNATTQWDRYDAIRKCNIFLKKAADSDLPKEWKRVRMAEARFLRAYFYMLLWTWHGGVPIITKVLNRSKQGDKVFKSRNTSEETFKFIVKESELAASNLPIVPEKKGRITKGAALTLKAWTELFEASPLHNPKNDLEKWAAAAKTYKRIIDSDTYALFPNYATLFYEENNYNKEVILSKAHIGGTSLGRSTTGYCSARYTAGSSSGWGMINPTQELVDTYRMKNGLPIGDPESGYDPNHPYLNREKRFYQSIVYDGSSWNGAPMYSRLGRASANELDLTASTAASNTGYTLRKIVNKKYTVAGGNQLSSANSILFRYAEVLLGYAEAQNEAVGPDESVYDAINQVRSRSDLPPLRQGLTQSEMRKAIYRERRVELAFEERRWYDLIRLKLAEDKLNGTLHAMKITEKNGKLNYKVISAPGGERKFFPNKNYFLPIPQSAIDRNSKLEQNPNY